MAVLLLLGEGDPERPEKLLNLDLPNVDPESFGDAAVEGKDVSPERDVEEEKSGL